MHLKVSHKVRSKTRVGRLTFSMHIPACLNAETNAETPALGIVRFLPEQSSCLLCMPDSVSKKVKYGALKYKTFWINSLVTTLCSYKKMLGKCLVHRFEKSFSILIWKLRRRPPHFKLSSFLMLTQPYL